VAGCVRYIHAASIADRCPESSDSSSASSSRSRRHTRVCSRRSRDQTPGLEGTNLAASARSGYPLRLTAAIGVARGRSPAAAPSSGPVGTHRPRRVRSLGVSSAARAAQLVIRLNPSRHPSRSWHWSPRSRWYHEVRCHRMSIGRMKKSRRSGVHPEQMCKLE
jgi:hypothetical protein